MNHKCAEHLYIVIYIVISIYCYIYIHRVAPLPLYTIAWMLLMHLNAVIGPKTKTAIIPL